MKTFPLVSTLTTVYNRAHLVERTIQSLLTQDYPSLEIVLVDNGSTDNTLEILQKYQSDPRVRIFHFPENTGSGGGRNRCVFNATGKYATYIDSDDELSEPQSVSMMVQYAEAMNGQISYAMFDCVDYETRTLTAQGLTKAQFVTLEDSLGGRFGGEHLHLFRRDWFNPPGFEEGAYGHEVIQWSRMLKIRPAYYFPYIARVYHKEGDDRISLVAPNPALLRFQARGYEAYLQEWGNDIKRVSRTRYVDLMLAWSKLELLGHQRGKALRIWLKSLQVAPQSYHLRLAAQLCMPTSLVWTLTARQHAAQARERKEKSSTNRNLVYDTPAN